MHKLKRLFAISVGLWLILLPAGGGTAYAQSNPLPAINQPSYSVLYSFQCVPDGEDPDGELTRDAAGNVYGTTQIGGAYGDGTVFEVSPAGTETLLHSFAGSPDDGKNPVYTNLIRDAAGDLYGTTAFGGAEDNGTVFRLAPGGTATLLHSFTGRRGDGSSPYAGLARSASGDLYGTTLEGGYGYGTIFSVTSTGVETPLYSFIKSQGYWPEGTLVQDSAGDFYGTASLTGGGGYGVVFELTTTGSYTILHGFGVEREDGRTPYAGLVRAPGDTFYGTTGYGGSAGNGTVFAVTAAGKYQVLYSFAGSQDGALPIAGLVRDPGGSLYGVTAYGGSSACYDGFMYGCGVLFEVTPTGNESVLYSFGGTPDGANPVGQLMEDTAGNLYGTTTEGGSYGCGTVFRYTP